MYFLKSIYAHFNTAFPWKVRIRSCGASNTPSFVYQLKWIKMKNCRITDINLDTLSKFREERKYPLQKAGFFGTTTVMESNVSFIFKQCLTMRQMMQLASKKQHGPQGVGSLKNASGSMIAEDIDRDVKYYIYEMADHFVKFGALRCLLNTKLLIEITDIKIAPTSDVDFQFEGEPNCPLLVASFREGNILNKDSAQEIFEWRNQAQKKTGASLENIFLSYDIAGPVYDTILTVLTSNATKLSPLYATQQKLSAGFAPSFILPLPSETEAIVKPPADPLTCYFPGCNIHAESRCGRCRVARYCTTDHQKAHWKEHKKTCNTRPALEKDDSVVVSISASRGVYGDMAVVSNTGKAINLPGDGDGLKSKFLVKVQASLTRGWDGTNAIEKNGPIMVYDAKRALSFHIMKDTAHSAQHEKLLAFIASRGIVTHVGIKCKAYLYARKEDDNLRIYMEEVWDTPEW